MKASGRLLPLAGLLLLTAAATFVASCGGGGEEATPTLARTPGGTAATSTATKATATSPPATATSVSPTQAAATSLPPTATVIRPTATETETPSVTVVYPQQGQAVPMVTRAELEVKPAELGELHPYVLVRPLPDDPNQDYWVQAVPELKGEGRWQSDPVYVGQDSDPSGTPFKLCAILTEKTLSRGERLHNRPDVPTECIDITRE